MTAFRSAIYLAVIILCSSETDAWAVDQRGKVPPGDLLVPAPPISSLTLTPPTVVATGSSQGQVLLSARVLGKDAVITLESSNSEIATLPASVTVPVGSSSASFTIQTRLVTASTSVSITAHGRGSFKTVLLKVDPLVLKSLISLDPYYTLINGGKTISIEAKLNSTAPPGGAVVMLATSQPSLVAIPGFVKVPAGALTATFPAVITAVKSPTLASLTGTFGGVSQGLSLSLALPEVVSIQVTPDIAIGGSSVAASVTLTGSAPAGGYPIGIRSDLGAVATNSGLTIPEGATQGTVTITTVPVSQTVRAKISAGSPLVNTYPPFALLTVNPPALKNVSFNSSSVSFQAGTVDGTITLSGPAAAGTSVPLSWSNADAAAAPPTVAVAEGATSATFKVTLKPVSAPTAFTLFAYYGGARMSATLTVNP